MKPEKPLTDKELEVELIESVRQMTAGKGCIVMLSVMSGRRINQQLSRVN